MKESPSPPESPNKLSIFGDPANHKVNLGVPANERQSQGGGPPTGHTTPDLSGTAVDPELPAQIIEGVAIVPSSCRTAIYELEGLIHQSENIHANSLNIHANGLDIHAKSLKALKNSSKASEDSSKALEDSRDEVAVLKNDRLRRVLTTLSGQRSAPNSLKAGSNYASIGSSWMLTI